MKKTYTKAVSATLASALAVGMVPAMALADDSVELLADATAELANGKIVATEKAVSDNGYTYVIPTEVETYTGATVLPVTQAKYKIIYYKVVEENGLERPWAGEDLVTALGDSSEDAAPAKGYNWAPGQYYAVVFYDSDANFATDIDNGIAVKFTVENESLAGAYLYEASNAADGGVSDDEFTYTGEELNIGLTLGTAGDLAGKCSIQFAKKNPADNKYYNTKDNKVIDAGDYAAIIIGSQEYTGYSNTLYFTVGKLDLSEATIALEGSLAYKTVTKGEVASSIDATDLTVNGESTFDEELTLSYDDSSFPDSTALANGEHTYTLVPKVDAYGKQVDPNLTGAVKVKVVRYAKEAEIAFNQENNASTVDFDPSKVKVTESKKADAEPVAYKLTYLKKDEKATGEKWDEVSNFAAPGKYKAVVTVDDPDYTYGGQKSFAFDVDAVSVETAKSVFLTYAGVNQADAELDAVYYNGNDFLKKVDVSVLDKKGNELVEGTDYVVVVTATVNNKPNTVVTEIVDANKYTIKVKAAEGSKYAVDASWNLEVKQAEVTPTILNQIDTKTLADKTVKYDNYDALWTGKAIQPVAGFTVADDRGPNGIDADKLADALEVPAANYSVVITYYKDLKNVEATPSTMPTEFVNPGTYKFKIVPAKTNVNFDFNIKTEYTFEVVADNVFADVKAGAWYAGDVYEAANNGWMGGYGNGMFGPNDGMKRGDLALALGRALDMDVKMTSKVVDGETSATVQVVTGFKDVDGGAYYAKAIKAMADAGIMTGYDDGTYGADELVTREQLATILARIEASGLGDASILASALDAYADADEVAGWAVAGVEWAVENGIMGVGTTFLNPGDTVSRAEVAAMLVRFDTKFDAFVVVANKA